MRFSPLKGVLFFFIGLAALAASADTNTTPVPLFTDVTPQSGIRFQHTNGEANVKNYIFEAKGGGLGFLDYDNDGWIDIFLVQGSTLELYRKGENPRCALYRNRRDGTFEDVTEKAGINHRGWGMGVTFGDFDNDGWTDIYVTYLGANVLYRNNGDGTFTDVTAKAGVGDPRWSSSAAFGDYDGDGLLDLYVCNYIEIDFDNLPKDGPGMFCTYRGVPVMCGPRGLPGAGDVLYRNNGDGTFTDVSEQTGVLDRDRLYGLGVVWADLDNDGHLDLYVVNDDGPNYVFANQGDGAFKEIGFMSGLAVSSDGRNQGSMGVDAADFDNDGLLDVFVTHFSNDYSTLYRNEGGFLFSDVTTQAEIYPSQWYLVSWGTRFADFNHDGWKDILHVNGHVTPFLLEIEDPETYYQPASLYLNQGDGTFKEATRLTGSALMSPKASRGAAFGDFDNDGDIDILIANLNDSPRLIRNDQANLGNWIMFRTVGGRSNRDGLGARITVRTGSLEQVWEIKRAVSIYSASDPRAHFGLGKAQKADVVTILWPSGKTQEFRDVPVNQHYLIDEDKGLNKEPISGR